MWDDDEEFDLIEPLTKEMKQRMAVRPSSEILRQEAA